MKNTIYDILLLIRKTGGKFNENDPIMLSGALAFFTVFAIPPILIMIIYCLGIFIGQDTATHEIFSQVRMLIGGASAGILQDIVEHYFVEDQKIWQRVVAIGIFIFASSSFFIIIQHALNRIWSVRPQSKSNVLKILENRALSFGIIICMGFILVLSLGTNWVLLMIQNDMGDAFPLLTPFIMTSLGIIISLVLGTLSFAVVYKFLPDVIIEWKVVWVGAAITSILFLLGKFIIGFALRSSNVQAMYGTAGSTAIFLLWVYYSSLILFFGAKITQQYALSFAQTIQPKEHAMKVITKEIKEADSVTSG